MRILHVARYGSIKGGAETYQAAICEQQRAAGHAVALAFGLDPDLARPEVAEGVQMTSLVEARAEASAREVDALLDAIRRFEADVVHVHAPDMAWIAPAAATGAPTLLAVHDHTLHCPTGTKYWSHWRRACTVRPGAWCLGYNLAGGCGSMRANITLQPYKRWRAARAAAGPLHLQCFSGAMRALLEGAGFDAGRITVTPYPAPPPVAPVAPAEDDERPVVFANGRLNKQKGFDLLLRALYDVGEDVHLVIAGHGHERPRLEQLAVRGPRGNRVTFTGWLSPGATAGWYERAAVVALPSGWVEPFGIVGLEAMSHGVPLVAFDTGGVGEWLADGETGLMVPRGNTGALGRAIGDLLRDPARRREMGEAGRRRVQAEFSLVEHVERLTTLYENVRRDRGQVA
ncbi:MAG TPA: glycosyltransferase family 4 protein [Actinomycetota bacterium]